PARSGAVFARCPSTTRDARLVHSNGDGKSDERAASAGAGADGEARQGPRHRGGVLQRACRFAASWDQRGGVFCRVMGPPLLQAEGTTREGGVTKFSQPHGTRPFAG